MVKIKCACCGKDLNEELVLDQYYPRQWIGARKEMLMVCRNRQECKDQRNRQREPKMQAVYRNQRRLAV